MAAKTKGRTIKPKDRKDAVGAAAARSTVKFTPTGKLAAAMGRRTNIQRENEAARQPTQADHDAAYADMKGRTEPKSFTKLMQDAVGVRDQRSERVDKIVDDILAGVCDCPKCRARKAGNISDTFYINRGDADKFTEGTIAISLLAIGVNNNPESKTIPASFVSKEGVLLTGFVPMEIVKCIDGSFLPIGSLICMPEDPNNKGLPTHREILKLFPMGMQATPCHSPIREALWTEQGRKNNNIV